MQWNYLWVIVFIGAAMSACNDTEVVREVDAELVPYFDRFVAEGRARGVDVDYDLWQVEGFVESIEGRQVLGQCSHSEQNPNAVIIDRVLWRRASDEMREQVIFHELGHCYLQRSHDDTKNELGICNSLMRSSTTICNINYTENRDHYLDELFEN